MTKGIPLIRTHPKDGGLHMQLILDDGSIPVTKCSSQSFEPLIMNSLAFFPSERRRGKKKQGQKEAICALKKRNSPQPRIPLLKTRPPCPTGGSSEGASQVRKLVEKPNSEHWLLQPGGGSERKACPRPQERPQGLSVLLVY